MTKQVTSDDPLARIPQNRKHIMHNAQCRESRYVSGLAVSVLFAYSSFPLRTMDFTVALTADSRHLDIDLSYDADFSLGRRKKFCWS